MRFWWLLPSLCLGLPAAYESPWLTVATDCPSHTCATSFATSLASRWANVTGAQAPLSACYLWNCSGGDSVAKIVDRLPSAGGRLVPLAAYNGHCSASVELAWRAEGAAVEALHVPDVYVSNEEDQALAMAKELFEWGPLVTHDGTECVVVYGWFANEHWAVLWANGTRGALAVRGSPLQRQWWAWRVLPQPKAVEASGWESPLQVLSLTFFVALLIVVLAG